MDINLQESIWQLKMVSAEYRKQIGEINNPELKELEHTIISHITEIFSQIDATEAKLHQMTPPESS